MMETRHEKQGAQGTDANDNEKNRVHDLTQESFGDQTRQEKDNSRVEGSEEADKTADALNTRTTQQEMNDLAGDNGDENGQDKNHDWNNFSSSEDLRQYRDTGLEEQRGAQQEMNDLADEQRSQRSGG